MAEYQSITNTSNDSIPGGTLPYGGSCTGSQTYSGGNAGAVPSSEVRSYEPLYHRQYTIDPFGTYSRNFSAIVKSGAISMTPYTAFSEKIEQFVASRENRFRRRYWSAAWCGSICGGTAGPVILERSWTQNDHRGSLYGLPSVDGTSGLITNFNDQIASAISTTKQAAYAKALSTYDLLSELGEARESITFLTDKVKGAADALERLASTDEESWKRARGQNARSLLKSSEKALRKIGGRWMEYRYAIMPIIYSIRDINDLLAKRDAIYKTQRDKESINLSFMDSPPTDKDYAFLYNTCQLEADVRSTVKLRYDRGALQRVISQTAFNPFKTAWELIPYSFVVDWFLNVSDAIVSATSIDLSSERACCTSVKKRLVTEEYLCDFTSDVSLFPAVSNPCLSLPAEQWVHKRTYLGLLKRHTIESYDRHLWSYPEPALRLNPFLNWKRFMDSIALSHQPIRKLLRSL